MRDTGEMVNDGDAARSCSSVSDDILSSNSCCLRWANSSWRSFGDTVGSALGPSELQREPNSTYLAHTLHNTVLDMIGCDEDWMAERVADMPARHVSVTMEAAETYPGWGVGVYGSLTQLISLGPPPGKECAVDTLAARRPPFVFAPTGGEPAAACAAPNYSVALCPLLNRRDSFSWRTNHRTERSPVSVFLG